MTYRPPPPRHWRKILNSAAGNEISKPEVAKVNREYEEPKHSINAGLDAVSRNSPDGTEQAAAPCCASLPRSAAFESHAQIRLSSALRLLHHLDFAKKHPRRRTIPRPKLTN